MIRSEPRCLRRAAPLVSLFVLTYLSDPAPASPPQPVVDAAAQLPAGVAFRLDGLDLPESEFHAFVGAEYRSTPKARALMESIAQEVIIDAEARRRGLQVTTTELEARIRRLDAETRRTSGGTRDLDAVLRDQGVNEAEFRLLMRKSLALEMVVREEFKGAAVNDAKITVWLQDRMKRARTITDGLSANLIARVDGEPVTTIEFGERLLAQYSAGDPERRKMENEYLKVELATRFAAARGITLSEHDVELAMAERERALQSRPGFEAVSLDTFLHKTGSSASELAARPSFRVQVLLRRLIDEVLFPGPEIYWLYQSRKPAFDSTYGRSADLSTIFLKAGASGATKAGFVEKTFAEAETELESLLRRFESGKADFHRVAAARSEHESAKQGGALGWINEASGDFSELAQAALATDAEYIGPIHTADGVHVIRVHGRRPAPEFLELQEAVRRHGIQLLLDARTRRAQVVRAR